VMSAAVLRLPRPDGADVAEPAWYLGQLDDGLLAVVLETADRGLIESCVSRLCASLREPVPVGDAEFHLTPHVGVAVLGQDATAPKALVDNARAAAIEAERDGSGRIHFFSHGIALRSLARLDSAREMREAIASRSFRLHYVGRHHLETGERVAAVGYLRWLHPVRGEVRPAEFVGIAEATGLALALSRAALDCVGEDFEALRAGAATGARISFGPLRHHVLHAQFVDDILEFLARGAVPAERLELRIAERTFVAADPTRFEPLVELGVQLVVDEVARRMASFDRLARAWIHGLQLDRAWVTALRSDPVALKVCRAGLAVATALDITPIAMGVDNLAQRDALVALGCRYGSGDLYAGAIPDALEGRRAAAAG
jgi:EAL domain-containing protein (putative c-di-GMP-specific phosphodiesterase class I)